MENYKTEHEQVNEIQCFFSKKTNILKMSILLIISILIAWYFWNSNHSMVIKNSASSYQEISRLLTNSTKSSVKNINDNTNNVATKFIRDNNNNYAVFIALELAKNFVVQNLFDKAEQQLILALTKTNDKNLLSLTNIRLARIQLQLKKLDKALQTLNNVEGEAWLAMSEDLRGDIFFAKGDILAARNAYTKASELNAPTILQTLLQLKLDDLSITE